MKKTLALFLAAAILWVPTHALADEFVLHFIPEGTRIELSGETYQAFNLEEYKLLITLDLRMYSDEKVMAELERRIGLEEQRNEKLQAVIDNLTTSNFQFSAELQRSYDKSDEWMARAEKAEMPKVWPWIVLAVGAGLGLLGVGLTLGSMVNK